MRCKYCNQLLSPDNYKYDPDSGTWVEVGGHYRGACLDPDDNEIEDEFPSEEALDDT